jgi:hypothetical protein
MDVVEKDPKERTTTKQPSHSPVANVEAASESTTFPDIFSSNQTEGLHGSLSKGRLAHPSIWLQRRQ